MIHPDDRGLFESFSASMLAEQPTQMTCRFLGADGVVRWVWTRAVPGAKATSSTSTASAAT